MNMTFIFFLLSNIGFVIFFAQKLKISAPFAPAAAVTAQILILYTASLFNLLSYTYYALFALGIVLFVYCCIQNRVCFTSIASVSFFAFIIISILICKSNKNTVLAEYDNFSHWALNIKQIYNTNALPTPDGIIQFYNYPPATALYCCYAMKIIGWGENIMLAAQGIITAAFLSVLFAKVSLKNKASLLMTTVCVFMMTCVIWSNMTELYVDSLLGFGGAALIFMSLHKKTKRTEYLPPILLSCVVSLIKNTGILIVVLAFAYSVIRNYFEDKETSKKNFAVCAATLLFPAFSTYLSYKLYKLLAYSSAACDTPFSIKTLAEGLRECQPLPVLKVFINSLFNFYESYISYFYICLFLFVAILLILKRQTPDQKRKYTGSLLAAFAVIAIWTLGLFISYTLMFAEEGLHTASFDRYFSTVIIIFTGIMILHIEDLTENGILGESKVLTALTALFAVPLLIITHFYYMPPDWKTYYHNNKIECRMKLEEAHNEYSAQLEDDTDVYCVINGYIEDWLASPYPKYEFMRKNAYPLKEDSTSVLTDAKEKVYLLYIKGNENTDKELRLLLGHFPEPNTLYAFFPDGNISPVKAQ